MAVGQYPSDDNAFVQTSEDGSSWITRSKTDYSIFDLYDVTFGNNMFLAGGWDYYTGRNIYTSSNGIDWSPHYTAMVNVRAVAAGGGTYVAVGDGVTLGSSTHSGVDVYYSVDTTNWNSLASGASSGLTDIAFGNNQFVAVDGGGYIYPLFNASRIANGLAGGSVSFCNGRFFIPAGPGTNLMSTTGLSWSTVTNTTGVAFGHVIYSGGIYVTWGGTNVFSSSDGTNWTRRNLQIASDFTLVDLAGGDRNLLALGYTAPPTPIKSIAFVTDPFVALKPGSSFPPQFTLSGLTGRTYRIEAATSLALSNWQALTNITLTNGPLVWTDLQATDACRFYRAALLP